MRKFITLTFIAFSLIIVSAYGDENKNKFDFNAYVRSNLQFSRGLKKGENISSTGGFAQTGRLQESQYFEISASVRPVTDSHFKLTLANGGDTFHYTDTWPDPGFAVRDLYYEVEKLPDHEKSSFWFGSRMYRGSDIHIYDIWPLDNQNILGGAYAYRGEKTYEIGFGVKKAQGYSFSPGATAATYSETNQRYILINKTEFSSFGNHKIKTNVELHHIPGTTGTHTLNLTTTNINVPKQYGVMAGFQHTVWDRTLMFLNYAWGDVIGGVNTRNASLAKVTTNVDTDFVTPGFASKKGSQILELSLSGSQEFEKTRVGLIYGALSRMNYARGENFGHSLSTAIRPMYYLTDHIHTGCELDTVHYTRTLTSNDINYIELSPMLEYVMSKNIFGVPKFKLIMSNVFYNHEVVKYGSSTKYAFNVAFGMELWF